MPTPNVNTDHFTVNKETLLQILIKVAPKIQELIPLDCNIGITDTENILFHSDAQDFALGDLSGSPVVDGSLAQVSMQTGELKRQLISKEVFGVPFKASAVPLMDDDGTVIGTILLGTSLKNQEKLTEAAQAFASTCEEVVASTEELLASAEQLADEMETLNALYQEMSEQVSNTDKMLDFIKKIAANSNLLGLNASIEAARVGQEGRGFEVVATEIRKMAENSAKSVEEIKEIIEAIKQKETLINTKTQNVLSISQHQASATEEISKSVQGLNSHAEEIEKIARDL